MGADALEQADDPLDIAHQGILGNFQLQLTSGHAGLEQRPFHFIGQLLAAKGHRRAIDRDLEVAIAVVIELRQS